MTKTKLKTITLKSTAFVRPSHALGSCGFYSKAWQLAAVKKNQSLIDAFLANSPNWKAEKRKQIRKQYIMDTIAETIGWTIVGALTYFTLKGFYWFAVVMLSF